VPVAGPAVGVPEVAAAGAAAVGAAPGAPAAAGCAGSGGGSLQVPLAAAAVPLTRPN
jgi:hypothetical protein